MKFYSLVFCIVFLSSCRDLKSESKYPINQAKFRIDYLPHRVEGDYKIFKFRVQHSFNHILSKVELTLDGFNGYDKLEESGKAIENNMQYGEERIFYIKLRAVDIYRIDARISDYEL